MSPSELAGKSIGRVPDGRDIVCPICGRSFRGYKLDVRTHEKNVNLVLIKCPYRGCGYLKRANRADLIFVKAEQPTQEHINK